MDYLVYAYLQKGSVKDATQIIQELKTQQNLDLADFKSAYAATAMPVRYVIEQRKWSDAESIADPPPTSPPHVLAIAAWARGLGFARNGSPQKADQESEALYRIEQRLRPSENAYWATQVSIMRREILAWSAQAKHRPAEAAAMMRHAADDEDGIEKLPVTPGPILPAREQLGALLLEQNYPRAASKAFAAALVNAPGRRGALQGAAIARERASKK